MQRTLGTCVGKMTYFRNSKKMVHFMPLKEFFVEDSLAFSHLFFLRTMRSHRRVAEGSGLSDPELGRWMAGTMVKHIAETVATVLRFNEYQLPAQQLRVIEFYGYVGLTFEYLKLLLQASKSPEVVLNGLACGPAEARLKFDILQSDGPHSSHYLSDGSEVDELLNSGGGGADIAIYNHDEAIHRGWMLEHSLYDAARHLTCPLLAIVRVALENEDATRYSIRGQRVKLETESDVRASLSKFPGNWIYRTLPGADDGFFLPLSPPVDDDVEDDGRSVIKPGTAVMLIVRTPSHFAIEGFRQL